MDADILNCQNAKHMLAHINEQIRLSPLKIFICMDCAKLNTVNVSCKNCGDYICKYCKILTICSTCKYNICTDCIQGSVCHMCLCDILICTSAIFPNTLADLICDFL